MWADTTPFMPAPCARSISLVASFKSAKVSPMLLPGMTRTNQSRDSLNTSRMTGGQSSALAIWRARTSARTSTAEVRVTGSSVARPSRPTKLVALPHARELSASAARP